MGCVTSPGYRRISSGWATNATDSASHPECDFTTSSCVMHFPRSKPVGAQQQTFALINEKNAWQLQAVDFAAYPPPPPLGSYIRYENKVFSESSNYNTESNNLEGAGRVLDAIPQPGDPSYAYNPAGSESYMYVYNSYSDNPSPSPNHNPDPPSPPCPMPPPLSFLGTIPLCIAECCSMPGCKAFSFPSSANGATDVSGDCFFKNASG